MEHRDLRPEVVVHLGEFQAESTAAEDDHRIGSLLQGQGLCIREVVQFVHSGNRRDRGRGSGADYEFVAFVPHLPDLDLMGRGEGGMAPHVLDVLQGREDIRVFCPPEVGDEAVLRANHSSEVRGPTILKVKPTEGVVRQPEELIADRQQSLAGHAADVDAGPSDHTAIDHESLRAVPVRADRRAEGRSTAAKDDEIVSRSHGLTPSSRVVARRIAQGTG